MAFAVRGAVAARVTRCVCVVDPVSYALTEVKRGGVSAVSRYCQLATVVCIRARTASSLSEEVSNCYDSRPYYCRANPSHNLTRSRIPQTS